ncbi:MAG: hypothetical protein KF729_25730 [Sandaracinaceae bacterium]|nr:hypothetical protein [Sandaracinaceae bacterium]
MLHAGCETDEPTDVQSYTDSAGRSCSVDLADITLVASCDADPGALVSCEVGQEPAFVLHDDYDFDTMITTRRSCPACIDRAARMTYVASSCATVQCTADADCLNRDGDVRPFPCAAGICTR